MNFIKKTFIRGWKYYNHAAIPTTAPHEDVELTPLKDGSIWKVDGHKPLLVRWTSDWDCGRDTDWWYIIKDAPFDLNALSSNSRKHIKEAFRKTYVEKIDAAKYKEELYECSHEAFLRYKNSCNERSKKDFFDYCENISKRNIEIWAGFDNESRKLIGWLSVCLHEDWAEIETAKFYPQYLKLRVSDALYATVLDYYLNALNKKYVSSGSRSINHDSNTQQYKEEHFGYRKAYCKLNILYSPKLKGVIKLLFPFRKVVGWFGKINKKIHLISALLKMEEIARMHRSNL